MKSTARRPRRKARSSRSCRNIRSPWKAKLCCCRGPSWCSPPRIRVETEGTYPLPEAQLDRFLLKIDMSYPSASEEADIVTRTTTDQNGDQLPLSRRDRRLE